MDQIRVNGIEEAERVLDEMIRNYPKQTVAAGLRAAAKPFVNRTKEAGPSPKFSKLAGVKVYTKGKEPLMAAGQFGGRTKRVWKTLSSYMSMYYISYWLMIRIHTRWSLVFSLRPKTTYAWELDLLLIFRILMWRH